MKALRLRLVILSISFLGLSVEALSQAPVLTSMSPTALAPGMQVTLTGSGFGSTAGGLGYVALPYWGAPSIVSWSDTQIVFTVPPQFVPGNLYVSQNGLNSNTLSYTVVPPVLTTMSPTALAPGMQVTLTGSGFGATAGGQGYVGLPYWGGPSIVSWSDTQIVFTVPPQFVPGNVSVTQNGANSNTLSYTVVPPVLTSMSPTALAPGMQVTLRGSGFGSAAGGLGFVELPLQNAPIVNWSDTQIVFTVPSGTAAGTLFVQQNEVNSNTLSFTATSGSFVPTAGPMPTGVYGQTATQLSTTQVLIAGGMSSSGVVNSAELYSLSSQTFLATNSMSVPRWLHTATLLNDGTVLITGGSSLSNETTLNSAEIYDPAAGTFTLLPSTLNTARVGHTATLLSSGQVLIVGGYDPTTGIIADAELYDPTAQVFIDLGNTNTPRYHHTSTLLQNGQVLITGGETDPTPSAAYNTAEVFNPQTWTFSRVSANMTSTREGHAATLLNDGTVLITGGDLPGSGSLSSAEIYNPSTATFTALSAAMTSPRISHSALLLNGGKVLLSGGANDSGGMSSALNSAELYDPIAQTFTAVTGSMTSVREHQTATLLNDGTVLESGGTDGTDAFNTAEIYITSKLTGLTSISVSPTTPSVSLGSQQLLTATGTFTGGGTQILSSVIWTTSSLSTSTISNDATDSGFVATLAQGTTIVTASAAGISGSATITVSAPALVSVSITPQSLTMPLGTTQQFSASGTYSDGSTQDLTSTATWTSSSGSATVRNTGLVATASLGNSTIQATMGSQSCSATVTVGAPALVSLSVTPSTATVAPGLSQQFQATGTYTDGSRQNLTSSVSWFAVPGSLASVNSSGLAAGIAQGGVNITAVYGSFSGVSTLTVGGPGLVSIAVLPNAASIPVGDHQQFVAMGTYADGTQREVTTASWGSSNSTASSIDTTGLVTALASGSTTVSASSGSVVGSATLTITNGTTSLSTSRYQHSATLLSNASVLIAGGVSCASVGSCTYLNSAELYNPSSGNFENTGSMSVARTAPAVLLGNGKVLIAGGYSCDSSGNCSSLSSAEIYDPGTGTFSSAGNMTVGRYGHTMTMLNNGQVLIAGGETCTSPTSCTALNTAELYNPAAGTFTTTGNLNKARFNASAVRLDSDYVLIAGGFDGTNYIPYGELYYAAGGTFSSSGTMRTPRSGATITLLNNTEVMIAGGTTCNTPGCPTASTELYYSSFFTYPTYPTGNMTVARFGQTATLLTNGQVFLTGGFDTCASLCISDETTELFDPAAATFTPSQNLSTGRSGHTATLLTDGSVLLIGGINNGITLSSTDLYQPASLAPPQLSSITISQPNPITVGQTVVLSAIGNFSDGSTYPLQSVVWTSSSPSLATVSNAAGSAGIVNAVSPGTTTITATVGTIVASIDVTMTSSLVAINVGPSNPTIAMGSSQILNLTATGTYSDGSSIDLTSDVTWTSSNTSVASVFDIPGNPAFVVPASPGSANVTATFGGTAGSTTVTVNMPLQPVPPTIAGVSPASGAAGTQVTITGSGFGPNQNSGSVLLGTNLGMVMSWSDNQIVATVSTGSSSGVAQIQHSNGASNSMPFTINTATIAGLSATSGVPGTQVTITGSGFGNGQGNGNVWLGTAPAVVNAWSDGQILATVASGAASGSVQVLQNGVMSNAVPFTINLPHISGVTPNSGTAGTVVTISGNGFGAYQGTGNVWIGNEYGIVSGWSDGQIVASVVSNAVSGIVKVQQSGIWSNAITFTVPTSGGGASLTLIPNAINLVVGGTQSIEAENSNGQSVTGLTWTSSNTTVATLSKDDPPIITAVGPGNATITAGTASAFVTVVASTVLPTGTVIWSNPGDGSGVSSIVPAVPSSTGVADVFALNSDCNVQAIKSDGTVGWTANIGTNGNNSSGCNSFVPDFQGGVVVFTGSSIYKLDGMTGQAYPAYTAASNHNIVAPLVHTDGTIFTIDSYSNSSQNSGPGGGYTSSSTNYSTLVAIDPLAGQPKFSVQMDSYLANSSSNAAPPGCGHGSPLPPGQGGGSSGNSPSAPNWGIIAGDGYLYAWDIGGSSDSYSQTQQYGDQSWSCIETGSGTNVEHLKLMRVGTGGDSYQISLADTNLSSYGITYIEPENPPSGPTGGSSGTTLGSSNFLITNADQGVLATYEIDTCSGDCTASNLTQAFYVATTSGPGLASTAQVTSVPGQTAPLNPVLQRADGSYIGTVGTGSQPGQTAQTSMIAFTSSGSTLWMGPNDIPQIATQGGVIGTSGTTYDQNGNVTGLIANVPIQSWTGNAYQIGGSVEQVAFVTTELANSFWAFQGANQSNNNASVNFFPPLGNCGNNPSTCPLGPGDAIWNAYQDLVAELGSDATPCSVAAKLYVFSKFKDANGYPLTRSSFVEYLTSKTPEFLDGTNSTWDYSNAACGTGGSGLWNWFKHKNCASPISGSIKSYFANNQSDSAATESPSYPFLTFLRPSSIETTNNGKTIDNEALLFHEALHGMTGLWDSAPVASLEGNLGVPPPSQNVTNYIRGHVLSVCPVNTGRN